MYEIKDRTYKIAEKLGVKIFPSDNPKKKIDVYDYNGIFICSIGASSYGDFPTYLEMLPFDAAMKRQQLYKKRHAKEIVKLGDEWEGSPSYYSWFLLWG
jgi:hypothetical protein